MSLFQENTSKTNKYQYVCNHCKSTVVKELTEDQKLIPTHRSCPTCEHYSLKFDKQVEQLLTED